MDNLKSIIPELKECRLTYDIDEGQQPPQPGEYLVSMSDSRSVWKSRQCVSGGISQEDGM